MHHVTLADGAGIAYRAHIFLQGKAFGNARVLPGLRDKGD